jgi:hypothetical protein
MCSVKTPANLAALAAVVSVLVAVAPAHGAPGRGTLFGTNANFGDLITINPVTGVGTVVGNTGAGAVPSLAVDPTTGIMYAGRGAGIPFIYTVDPATGAATLVGDSGLGLGTTAVAGLDFRSDGTLFAAVNIVADGGTGSDHLATIDEATGEATVIGAFGTEGIEGIAFDPSGTLWGSARLLEGFPGGPRGTPGLYKIDPATGTATFERPILDASGAPPGAVGVVSLQFACDGTLYGGTARSHLSSLDSGRLVTINPTTGRFAFVGSATATGFRASLGALAFSEPCLPTSKEECKDGGWRVFGVFKNQGDCVSFVATRGRNPPAGVVEP